MPTSSEHYDVIVIGGGAIGLSVAYHLGHRRAGKILVLERHQLTSGTSWHAAGIVGPLRATPGMTRLATYATELFPTIEDETGQATGYRQTGGYWLARTAERHDEMHRIAAVGRQFGLTPQMCDAAELTSALPCVNADGITLAMQVPEDGSVNPVDLCMAYAKGARNLGVEIVEGARVARLIAESGRAVGVMTEDGSVIRSHSVVLATGAWSRELAADVGLDLPLQAVEHMYIVTEPRPEFAGFPVLRDLDRNFYVKGDAGKLLIGVFEQDATCWNPYGAQGDIPFLEMAENWDWFTPYMESALALIPELADTGIQFYMNGPESFTSDTRPLIGPAPAVDGLYVAAGMNSLGIMSSAGVGKMLAEWIVDGAPEMDAWEVDVARADPLSAEAAHLEERMREAVAASFDVHWPYKQPATGRDLRRSALHECWAGAGAHFGVTAGWERPLWFSENDNGEALPYSVGDQPWWPITSREAGAMKHGAAMLELSPFTKIELSGRDAFEGLDFLASANIDRAVGTVVYTPLLNDAGGIEADVTILRKPDGRIRITSGAATRWRDLHWLRRNLDGDIVITDVTEDHSVIGVMGAASRTILGQLDNSWSDTGFGRQTDITIAGKACTALRISFVGELGWEIETETRNAPAVFQALHEAGASPMGHYALDGCRIEKGFAHWGHDLGPDLTPLEAGLGFAVDWSKRFQGRERLLHQRENGLEKSLALLLAEGTPLLLHDEPVWEDDHVVGFTTSGGYGPRVGRHLAMAVIESPRNGKAKAPRHVEIEVAGVRCPAVVQARAVFDPERKRMKQ